MTFIMDTYAWVEYLIGSRKGVQVQRIIESGEKLITPECCLAELKGWCIREKRQFKQAYHIVRTNSEIEPIFTGDWLKAADIRNKKRKQIPGFGLIDAIIVSKQAMHKAKILSGDPHFKSLKSVEYLDR